MFHNQLICTLLFLLFAINASVAQNSFGFEFRTSRNITYNPGEIIGAYYGLSGYVITNEENAISSNYSFGILYSIGKKSTFKLHLGRHANGRIFDIVPWDDTNLGPHRDTLFNINSQYKYLQLVPSYSYNIRLGKSRIPFEVGLGINKHIKAFEVYVGGIEKYNFDLRLSAGYEFEFIPDFYLGAKFVYSKALTNYLDMESMVGEFYPTQIGIEVSAQYSINIAKKQP